VASASVVLVVILLGGLWAALYMRQLRLRSQAEALLADVQRIQVGTTSSADAQALVARWYQLGAVETDCRPDGCTSLIRLQHALPRVLTGDSDTGSNNLLARMADHLGLRNAAAGAGVRYKNGVVTGKGFSVEVTLPRRDWFARGAFVPDLLVLSDEQVGFTETELQHVVPTHPYRIVRRLKGPYGLRINFMPQEPADQKAQYMDFRFACITQLAPCHQESEILPAASELAKQVF
jgi:hypothetical protein